MTLTADVAGFHEKVIDVAFAEVWIQLLASRLGAEIKSNGSTQTVISPNDNHKSVCNIGGYTAKRLSQQYVEYD